VKESCILCPAQLEGRAAAYSERSASESSALAKNTKIQLDTCADEQLDAAA
jgi:hypothetical protein